MLGGSDLSHVFEGALGAELVGRRVGTRGGRRVDRGGAEPGEDAEGEQQDDAGSRADLRGGMHALILRHSPRRTHRDRWGRFQPKIRSPPRSAKHTTNPMVMAVALEHPRRRASTVAAAPAAAATA